ncbi:Subtilase family protein [Actinokineospora alba]|uniref:Subtilase family protein n=1 Tax=Actinokineospora alba TaxID=504798 RepID=A0A1H0UVA2_9PSEU|nr:S8 family serine peptidase [Actinokineospora alba]TDP69029.1 subtilase family protein [Actinokineospora alba]SDI77912.1 Subtilase family protein [Actinokineospora alba]SDP70209.1 Subtilase family protein [Actinokineospora alba]
MARFAMRLRPDQDPAVTTARLVAERGAQVEPLSADDPDILIIDLPDRVFATDADAFSDAYTLADDYGALAVEPDLPTALFPEPDPVRGADFPPGCWSPEHPNLAAEWALWTIRAPQAWEYSRSQGKPERGEGIVVGQPDTGVIRHRELDGVLAVQGYDFVDNDNDPTDPLADGNPGHGTATASVIVSPNTHVVTGAAPRVRHMAIRAIESVVRVTQVSVAKAVVWATDHGAHVITMSLGGLPSFALDRAINRAVAANVIVMAAAGNCVGTVVWPARYDNCVAVAGTTPDDTPWRGTCKGKAVDISAPGENVYRARIPQFPGDGDSGQGQGTSLAVALTAAVAALWLAHHGRDRVIASARGRGETVQALFQRLIRDTARRPPGWNTNEMGAGIIDAQALLTKTLDARTPTADAAGTGSVPELITELLGDIDLRVDWDRYGPELASLILRTLLGDRTTTLPSGELRAAITNEHLRRFLRL